MWQHNDWMKYVLSRKMVNAPGKRFNYSSGLTLLLGGIIRNTTGMRADKFAEEHLFRPLGISNYTWYTRGDGTVNTFGGLVLTPRDMAKIGYLFLRHGDWNGRQIVSQEWVTESTKAQVTGDVVLGSGYGYQWWCGTTMIRNRSIETFYGAGRGGQHIFVVPALDTIAVFTSEPYDNSPDGDFRPQVMMVNYLVPAILHSNPIPRSAELTQEHLDACVGKYRLKRLGIELNVVKKERQLYFKTMGQKIALDPVATDRFSGTMKDVGEIQVDFVSDGKGDVKALILTIGFSRLRYERSK
jgi:CubicO group peptidase (beta-lactamase class C family)